MAKCFCCGAELSQPTCERCGYDVRSGVRLLTKPQKAYCLPQEEPGREIPASVSLRTESVPRFTREVRVSSRFTPRSAMRKILLGILCVVLLAVGGIVVGHKIAEKDELAEEERWKENGFIVEFDLLKDVYVVAGYRGEEAEIYIPGQYNQKPVVIGAEAFLDNQVIEKVTLEEGITNIRWNAFDGCTNLTEIHFPESLQSIEFFAFDGCEKLETILVPENVTELGTCAFADCTNLKTAVILANVAEIDSILFSGCKNLQFLVIPGSVRNLSLTGDDTLLELCFVGTEKEWAAVEWANREAFRGKVILKPDFQVEDGDALFRRQDVIWKDQYAERTDLYETEIPNGTKYISQGAFRQCTNLQSVTIPGSVVRIGKNAFHLCSGLQSVTIEEGVQQIGESAFGFCEKLESVTIPNGVTRIENKAFDCCFDLKFVTIPGSVTYMGNQMFDCSNLEEIRYTGTQAQWEALNWEEKETYKDLVVFVETES